MSAKDWLEDYVPVEERIAAFYADHPNGSLQSDVLVHEPDRVTVKATAYRDPDDKRPGIGHSSMAIPGATTFTRGSELENAETSAWGRALKALGYGAGPSREEMAATTKPSESEPPGASASYPLAAPTTPRTAEEDALLTELLGLVTTRAQLDLLADAVKVPEGRRANAGELRAMLQIARQPAHPGPTGWPEPGSAAYKALNPFDRATAKAWHAEKQKQAEGQADIGF